MPRSFAAAGMESHKPHPVEVLGPAHETLIAAEGGFLFASETCDKNYLLYIPADRAELASKK